MKKCSPLRWNQQRGWDCDKCKHQADGNDGYCGMCIWDDTDNARTRWQKKGTGTYYNHTTGKTTNDHTEGMS